MWMGKVRGVEVRLRASSLIPSFMPWMQRDWRSSRSVRGLLGVEGGKRPVWWKVVRVSRLRGVSVVEKLDDQDVSLQMMLL